MKIGTSDLTLYLGSAKVDKVYLGTDLVYGGGQPSHDYSQDYLTFNILSGGTINWKASHSPVSNKVISYSFDDGTTWTELSSTTINGVSFSVNAGDTVLLKGTNEAYANLTQYNTFSGSTAYFDVEGNIMSLIYGDNFVGQTALTLGNEFRFLFVATNIISAENLVLPATALGGYYNYTALFHQCSKMVLAPKILPALTVPQGCYNSMFNGCTSLTTAPELPATSIGTDCYKNMFINCTSLTTAPVLHIATVNSGSYQNMFQGCTSLNAITCLATDVSAANCTANWVSGVAATGTFTKAASMSNWSTGVNGIPDGWTVVDYVE